MVEEAKEITREEFICRLESTDWVEYVNGGWKSYELTLPDLTSQVKKSNSIYRYKKDGKRFKEMLDHIRKPMGEPQRFYSFLNLLIEEQNLKGAGSTFIHRIFGINYFYRIYRIKKITGEL